MTALYCHDSNDVILALDDGIKTAQPWPIDGRIIDFNKATPKEIWLTEPCSTTSFMIIILYLKIIFEITVYVVKTQRSGKIYT